MITKHGKAVAKLVPMPSSVGLFGVEYAAAGYLEVLDAGLQSWPDCESLDEAGSLSGYMLSGLHHLGSSSTIGVRCRPPQVVTFSGAWAHSCLIEGIRRFCA